MEVSESFIVAQQPTVLTARGSSIRPLYTSGNNVHNDGTISFTAGLVPKLDLQVSYANNLYAYEQTFGDVFNPDPPRRLASSPAARPCSTAWSNWPPST